MVDIGLTHVALQCRDLDASIAFYARYAHMRVVHRRHDGKTSHEVAWLSDETRPFVIVLIEAERVQGVLGPIAHLGVGCASRDEVDRYAAEARAAGISVMGPEDWDYPVGYFAFLHDPDGHVLELSHGQEVALTLARAADEDEARHVPE
ncbi:VOC family protein [Govanella unica]|uniref:VOC family protein n=1 Tax=Govanella unica TaxID=2975056 RepID=A0A9X3Z6K8_9PROT|nr:VOC family protein [Govania unica]MDA5193305.1 VOC family protein [Govania unica]